MSSPPTPISHQDYHREKACHSPSSQSHSHSRPYTFSSSARQTMAASIPVPRMPPTHPDPYYPHPYSHRIYSPASSTVDRTSPPQSSVYRNHSHPYRREEPSRPDPPPRITLPPPNSSFRLPPVESNSPRDRDFPSLTHDRSWRSASTGNRPPSAGSGEGDRERTPLLRSVVDSKPLLSLPSLHSLSGGKSGGGASPAYPPPLLSSARTPSATPTGRASPRLYPYQQYYHDYEPSHHPPHAHGPQPGGGSSRYREAPERHREEMYDSSGPPQPHPYSRHSPIPAHIYDAPSPPLRPVHHTMNMTPVAYPGVYPGHQQHAMGRTGSHSSVGAGFSRPSTGDEDVGSREQMTPGQSRRLAHLMSEQKRRESINSGFQSLRAAIPASLPTDSKAVILRKAVSRVNLLESLLKQHGIDYTKSPSREVVEERAEEEWDEDRDTKREESD